MITPSQISAICKKLKKDLVNYSFLSQGAHNKSFLINTKQGKLVLRIENNLQFKNLKKEYTFLKKTKGALGPKVFLFDNSHKIIKRDYLIEEFIEGKHPSKKATHDFIVTMALWYKQLHKTKTTTVPKFAKKGNEYSLHKTFHHFCIDSYTKYRKILGKPLREQLDNLFTLTEDLAKQHQPLFSKQRSFPLIHSDPTPTNIFYSPGKVKLIDWEFVQYDQAEYDLSFFIRKYRLTTKQQQLFLDTYGYPTTKKYGQRLDITHLRLILMIIKWLVERLHLVYDKKIDSTTHASTEKEILQRINKELPGIKKLIKKLS